MTDKTELKIFKQHRNKLISEINKILDEIENDPYKEMIKIHEDFNNFLIKYKGKERSSEEAMKKLNKLSDRDKENKVKMKKFTSKYRMNLHDREMKKRFEIDDVNGKISSLEWRINNNN